MIHLSGAPSQGWKQLQDVHHFLGLKNTEALTCSKEFFAALPVSREHEQMVSTQPCLDPLGYFTVSHKNTTVWPWLCNMMEPKKSLLPDSKNLGCWHNMSMA
ncbi:uncharacterized protein LOC144248887 isoform X2 [Lonchura striata]